MLTLLVFYAGKRTKYNAKNMARAQSMIKEGVTLPKVFERTGIPIRSLRDIRTKFLGLLL